jgi:cell division transport system permease protein
MRLVGASRWYTQLPFILEAALAGLVGGLLAVGGLVLTKLLFVDRTLAGPIKSGIITGIDWSQVITTGLEITAAGVVVAAIASYLTLRLYVRL